MMSAVLPSPPWYDRPVVFPDWSLALARADLPAGQRCRFGTEITRFLRYCEVLDVPVTPGRSREYLAIVPLVAARPGARIALRWYFRAARSHPGRAGVRLVSPAC
jgi:hypothetical protein